MSLLRPYQLAGLAKWQGRADKRLITRFQAKVDVRGVNECWPWVAALNENGYGVLGRGGRGQGNIRATHVAVFLATGEWCPVGMYVCHRCNNPPCCNPTHLYIGTPKRNRADAKEAGRDSPPPRQFGLANVNGKLSMRDVRDLRQVWREYGGTGGFSFVALGRTFGISDTTAKRTVRRMVHTHVK